MNPLLGEMRATWRLALPMVIGQVASHLVQFADMAMIGRVGVHSLAAASFANNVFFLFILFSFGLGSALSILVSEAHGRRDHAEKLEILRIGLLVCGAAAVVGALALSGLVLGTNWWHLGQPEVVLAEAKSYLIYLAVSMVPLLLFSSLKGYCEAVDDPWNPLLHLCGAIAANVFFNWVFIFGNLGAPAMGLDGAGLATVMARTLSVVTLWIWMGWARKHRMRWRWREFFRFEVRRKWELIRLGTPIGLQISFEVATFNVAVFMMGWMPNGPVAIAAHAIAMNYCALAFMVPLGVMFAVSIRVGQARGDNNLPQARRIGLAAAIMVAAFMLVVAFIFITFRDWLPFLFLSVAAENEVELVLALASKLLLFGAIFAVFDGLQVVLIGALRGFRDVRIPTIISFVTYWVICLPLGFVLAFRLDGTDRLPGVVAKMADMLPAIGQGFGAEGIWIALCIALSLAGVVASVRFWWVVWRGHAPQEVAS